MRRHPLTRALFAIAWIWALFLPRWSAAGITLDPRPPVVLCAVLLLLALLRRAGWRLRDGLAWVMAVLIALLAVLPIASGAVEQILDRPLDLYFDLRQVPNLLALYRDAAGMRGLLALGAAALGAAVALWLTRRALGAIAHAMAPNPVTASVSGIAVLGLLLPLLPGGAIDQSAAAAAGQQARAAWRDFAAFHGLDRHYAAMLRAPEAAPGPLPGLKGKDVYLIFIESYGTVALDDPGYHAGIEPALAEFAADAGAGGYRLLSSRLVSPVYGGGSWLAHGTIASGLKLDPVLNALLLNSDRLSLPRYLSAAGYRTVEVMPGIKQPDPDAAFWGFDAHDFAAELGYRGPPFGWFTIPDQYTLQQFSARELTSRQSKRGHKPLFAQIVLVSSHTPFAPVPPYDADWSDVPRFSGITQPQWQRIYAPPNFRDLDPYYLASIAYDLKTLGAWLQKLDRAALIIVLGDHEPPNLTRGAGQPWTVPVYVLSRDADLVAPFAALGYGPGDEPPPRANPEGMERFLGDFLSAYRAAAPKPAAALRQSPPAPAASRP